MGITEFVIAFALAVADGSGTAAISWAPSMFYQVRCLEEV